MLHENHAEKFFLPDRHIPLHLEAFSDQIEELAEMNMIYHCAIREISTKIAVLNEEFQIRSKRNPIEYIKSRIKTPQSIAEKLARRGYPVSISSAREHLNDIAGIRVVCSFVDDIYMVADMLKRQTDLTLIEEQDYIKHPKCSGYRSLHLTLEIPVFFSDSTQQLRVEVQIRTLAMDFWASLEHQLNYKTAGAEPEILAAELRQCAEVIAETDRKMQGIHYRMEHLDLYKK